MIFDVVVVYGHRAVGQVTAQCSPTFEAVVQCLSDPQTTIVIEVADDQELKLALQSLRGQLTATLIGEPGDLQRYQWLVPVLEQKVGRILVNGYPTGVEVCEAMVHGGPSPATSDSRGTSVGTLAIDRFLRPVCFQNYPDALLPPALQNSNPLQLKRLINSEWSETAIG